MGEEGYAFPPTVGYSPVAIVLLLGDGGTHMDPGGRLLTALTLTDEVIPGLELGTYGILWPYGTDSDLTSGAGVGPPLYPPARLVAPVVPYPVAATAGTVAVAAAAVAGAGVLYVMGFSLLYRMDTMPWVWW